MQPSYYPRKVCLVGASAVGKTSLVARFVHGRFSEQYLTTIGVKIDRKPVDLGDGTMELLLWDLNGEDRFQAFQLSRLRGAAGFVLVADSTRRETFDEALDLHRRIEAAYGAMPFVCALNKTDLLDEWDLDAAQLSRLAEQGWRLLRTSARTGDGVEEAFRDLARQLP